MSIIGEAHDEAAGLELLKVLQSALKTEKEEIISFVKDHIYPLYKSYTNSGYGKLDESIVNIFESYIKIKIKKDLKVKKTNENIAFERIDKGTVVDYNPATRTIKYRGWNFVIDQNKIEKYFTQIYKMDSDISVAGRGLSYPAKEWKRIYGYEVGLMASMKFTPILI